MKKINIRVNLNQLNALTTDYEKLAGVNDLEFSKNLLTTLESLETAKNQYILTPKVQEYKEQMSQYQEDLKDFDEKRHEILAKYAKYDENGVMINIPQKDGTSLYDFDDKTFLCDLTPEEIKKVFGEADLIDYVMKDKETGLPILKEDGSFTFAATTSVESIQRFSEITELELEYKPVHDEVLKLHKLSEQESFDVELELLEEEDFSKFLNLKDYVLISNLTANKLLEYDAQIKTMIEKEMEELSEAAESL